jgi:hypothetical protein
MAAPANIIPSCAIFLVLQKAAHARFLREHRGQERLMGPWCCDILILVSRLHVV